MPTLTTRSILRFGREGLAITLPKAWSDYYQLRPGDRVGVMANGQLLVEPLKQSQANRHLSE